MAEAKSRLYRIEQQRTTNKDDLKARMEKLDELLSIIMQGQLPLHLTSPQMR
jgi:hypothetical protein